MFETDDDYMQVGELIPVDGEWFLDTETGIRFRLNDDGDLIDEDGDVIARAVDAEEHIYFAHEDDLGYDFYE